METKKISYIGLDDGHYALKLCYEKDGELKGLMLPSRIAYNYHKLSEVTGKGNNDHCMYETDSVKFTVLENFTSLNNEVIDLRGLDYPISEVNAILIYHTLLKAGFTSEDSLKIVTGLPYKEYYLNGKKNEILIAKKSQNLNREIRTLTGVKLPEILSHNVLAEGAGAYIDLAISDDGKPNDGIIDAIREAPLAIVDIGGKTTDIVTMDTGGKNMRIGESNTAFIGALDLNQAIGAEIMAKLGLNNIVTEKIEKAIEMGEYMAFGQKHDVTNIVLEQKKVFARKIADEMKKILKDASNIGVVAFVGGGSILLKKELSEIYGSQSQFVKDPQFANARGFYKAAKYIFS